MPTPIQRAIDLIIRAKITAKMCKDTIYEGNFLKIAQDLNRIISDCDSALDYLQDDDYDEVEIKTGL